MTCFAGGGNNFLAVLNFSHFPVRSSACANALFVKMQLLIDDEQFEQCKVVKHAAFDLQRE
jgi:hypothetical protein